MAMNTFSPGSVIKSSEVNFNFSNTVACDTARAITVTHTWSSSQTFTGGWTAGAACSVAAGGLTVSAGTTAVQALTATSGSFTGTVTVNQLNPFSLGSFKILGGSTSLSLRNNADSADNLLLSDAGAATVRGAMTSNVRFTGSTSASGTAWAATGFEIFCNTTFGAMIGGYGTTNDVTITNRAGTAVMGIAANSTAVTFAGTVTCSTRVVSDVYRANSGVGNITIENNAGSALLTVVKASGATTVLGGLTAGGHLLFSADATYNIGAIGATRPNNIYAAGSIFSGSSRALKEQVQPFGRDALDIINAIDVVSYRYKATPDVESVGFIAEDVDELLSGPNKKDFNINNSIGLLIRAVQQLSAR